MARKQFLKAVSDEAFQLEKGNTFIYYGMHLIKDKNIHSAYVQYLRVTVCTKKLEDDLLCYGWAFPSYFWL